MFYNHLKYGLTVFCCLIHLTTALPKLASHTFKLEWAINSFADSFQRGFWNWRPWWIFWPVWVCAEICLSEVLKWLVISNCRLWNEMIMEENKFLLANFNFVADIE